MKKLFLVLAVPLTMIFMAGITSCSKKQIPVKEPVEATAPEPAAEPPPPPPVEPGGEGEPILESELEPNQPSPRELDFEHNTQLLDISFEYDKSDLTVEARDVLKKNADWINTAPGVRIQIEGHTDERGTVEYNLALGERRARMVKNYLISLGVDPARLYTISYGEELPVNPEHNEAAWAQNRRAHFLVTQ